MASARRLGCKGGHHRNHPHTEPLRRMYRIRRDTRARCAALDPQPHHRQRQAHASSHRFHASCSSQESIEIAEYLRCKTQTDLSKFFVNSIYSISHRAAPNRHADALGQANGGRERRSETLQRIAHPHIALDQPRSPRCLSWVHCSPASLTSANILLGTPRPPGPQDTLCGEMHVTVSRRHPGPTVRIAHDDAAAGHDAPNRRRRHCTVL